MTRVMFVCLGNICRSPMAEGLLLHKLDQRGLSDAFRVESSGTGGWHAGEPPDPRTLAELRRHGIGLDSRAQQLKAHHEADFDWFLCMDSDNLHNARAILGDSAKHKLHLTLAPTSGGSVPDPYYGGVDGFGTVYRMLDESLDAWLDRWTAGQGFEPNG